MRKREARKQKLAEADDELLSTSAKRDCGDKAKSVAKVRRSCRSWKMLQNEFLDSKIGFDIAL